SNLHFEKHHRKADRTRLMYTKHQGYKLLTALAISDKNGVPLAPVCLELASARGLHSTRSVELLGVDSPLDGLTPVMAEVAGLGWGKPVVFVIDREADSVGHYHKLLKSGGLQIESWQQQSAPAFAKRLLVGAAAVSLA
ncbi:MAG: hypothetical protein FWD61_20720, partial [Phycisphaerales bacterium]|nr:hypothetical protein [Phycisphaerales bacterium]